MGHISVRLNPKEAEIVLWLMRSTAESSDDRGVVQVSERVAKRIERAAKAKGEGT